jgi:hypothetical protein
MFERQAGLGETAVEQVQPVLDLLECAFDDLDESGQVGETKSAMARRSRDRMPSAGFSSGA